MRAPTEKAMVINDADFDPSPPGERNLKCEEFYHLIFPSCSTLTSIRYLGLANRSVLNTKAPIGTKSSCGKSPTEATDLSGSKIISTMLAVAAQQGFILSRELLHCWANSAFACAEIHTRRQCQCRKSHTPDASRTRTVAPEYQYVQVRRSYPVGPQAGH